ncbi:MAG: hypothetical protein ACKVQS_10195 [Fimbriimonadaceae bacterium]
MILNALCFLLAAEPDVRVLEERGIGSPIVCTITRTAVESGGLIWEEKSVEDRKTSWLDRREIDGKGGFVSQLIDWRSEGGDSLWQVGVEADQLSVTMVKYRGEVMGGTTIFKKLAMEGGDPSLLWWNGVNPEKGTKVNGAVYLALNGVFDLEVEYVGDFEVMVKGKRYATHKVVRRLSARNETWWVDDKGLPVLRYFWTKSEDKPHRIDEMK